MYQTSVMLHNKESSQEQERKLHCTAPPFLYSDCGEQIYPLTSWKGHSLYPPCCSNLEPWDELLHFLHLVLLKKIAALFTVVTAGFNPENGTLVTKIVFKCSKGTNLGPWCFSRYILLLCSFSSNMNKWWKENRKMDIMLSWGWDFYQN